MQNLTSGGSITVPLSNLQSQNLNLVYYIVLARAGSQSVRVMGLFRTGEWYMGAVMVGTMVNFTLSKAKLVPRTSVSAVKENE